MVANKKRFTLDLDPDFQTRLKVAAALKGISMRQYCVAAIESELTREKTAEIRKPGLTEDEWEKDSYECFREAKAAYPLDRIDNAVQRMAEKCLEARGYTKDQR